MPRVLNSPEYLALRKELVHAREQEQLTQTELAEKLGKSQSFVSKYEQGERRLDIVDFVLVCKALSISPVRMLRDILQTAGH